MTDLPRADIRLGYLCNHNCRFCCVSEHRKENMSTAEAIREMEESRKFGAEKLVFTGGEPTIRKDIVKLVEKGKALGFKDILIITNGQMCSYPEFLDKLVKAGLTSLCFSLPDYRQDVYEHLTQSKGSFERLMKGIENAKKYNLQISTITTIHKLNYKELPKITEFLIVLNRQFKRFFSEFVFINPTDNAWKYREELVPRLSEVTPYVHKSLDLAKEKGLVLNVEAIPLCYMQGYFDHVVEMHMAKKRRFVQDGKEDDQYNERRVKEGKAKGEKCKDCEYNDMCEGVWKRYVEMYGDEELQNTLTDLIVSRVCNNHCLMCSVSNLNRLDEFSTKEVKSFIDKLITGMENRIGITGGEPSLRSDLIDLLRYIREKNKFAQLQVISNGRRFKEKQWVNQFKNEDLGKMEFCIAVHGQNESIHDSITQVEGSFKETIEGIKNLLNEKFKVEIRIVVHKLNYNALPEILGFISKEMPTVERVTIVNMWPINEAITHFDKVGIKVSEIAPYVEVGFKKTEGMNITLVGFPSCVFSEEFLFMLGRRENKKGREKRMGFPLEECERCNYFEGCQGIWRTYITEFGIGEFKLG